MLLLHVSWVSHKCFVVSGLIIDAFGELRDQQEQVKEDMEVRDWQRKPFLITSYWSPSWRNGFTSLSAEYGLRKCAATLKTAGKMLVLRRLVLKSKPLIFIICVPKMSKSSLPPLKTSPLQEPVLFLKLKILELYCPASLSQWQWRQIHQRKNWVLWKMWL